ncbi:MAG: hypothetical protein ACO3KD_05880 [Gaiellales bacterium]
MDRLDLELYAERLARLVERTADDLADARLRLAWADLEADFEPVLTGADAERLRAIGVLAPLEITDVARRAVVERAEDLAVLHRLQALVERRRASAQPGTGVTATSRPPSSS